MSSCHGEEENVKICFMVNYNLNINDAKGKSFSKAFITFLHICWKYTTSKAVVVHSIIFISIMMVFTVQSNVSWQSQLDPQNSILESSNTRRSSCELWESRIENRVSRIEKQGLFKHANSKKELSRKWFISQRMNNSRSHAKFKDLINIDSQRIQCQLVYTHETTQMNNSRYL